MPPPHRWIARSVHHSYEDHHGATIWGWDVFCSQHPSGGGGPNQNTSGIQYNPLADGKTSLDPLRSVQFSSVQYLVFAWCSWAFGLDFTGHYFISSIIMFKVQFSISTNSKSTPLCIHVIVFPGLVGVGQPIILTPCPYDPITHRPGRGGSAVLSRTRPHIEPSSDGGARARQTWGSDRCHAEKPPTCCTRRP